jgi:PKD repeat protein
MFDDVRSYTVTITVGNSSGSDSVDSTLSVSPQSTILPLERKIDWSRAGVWYGEVKGIPVYPVGITMQSTNSGASYYLNPNGTTDCRAAIQAAVTACPANRCVLLPAGTFAVYTAINLKSGVSVRGAGAGVTTLVKYGTNNLFSMSGSLSQSYTTAVSGYTKGSDAVVVSDPSIFAVGDMVRMDQLNDPAICTNTGVGTSTWCGRFGVDGTRALGECMLVTEKNGSSIKFNRPLYYSYNASYTPQLGREYRSYIKWAGIEDLTIQPPNTNVAGGNYIYGQGTVYCWAKGVEGADITNANIYLGYDNYGFEVRDCYFHEATIYDAARGTGIRLSGGTNDSLIENNIVYWMHDMLILDSGCAGNVIGYNLVRRVELHDTETWFGYQMGFHGPHCFMNLLEGNEVGKVQSDNYFGSSSHNVFFRNHITRENYAGFSMVYDIVAADVNKYNYYVSFIGNIIGTPGCAGPVEQNPFLSTYHNSVLWKVGYQCCSGTGSPDDPKVAATLIRTGNWEGTTNAVQWDPNIADHTIPDSLYLTSKPSWFGVLAWPPFTPERSGFNPANVNKIPAQVRFENGPAVGLPYIPARGY